MIIYLAAWLLFNVQIVLGLSSLKGSAHKCVVKDVPDYTNNYSNNQRKCSDLDDESETFNEN
jgi:hypothetical protein